MRWNWRRLCRRGLGRETLTANSKWLTIHQTRDRFYLPADRQFCRIYLYNLWTWWLWTPSLRGLTRHWSVHFHRSTLSFRYTEWAYNYYTLSIPKIERGIDSRRIRIVVYKIQQSPVDKLWLLAVSSCMCEGKYTCICVKFKLNLACPV